MVQDGGRREGRGGRAGFSLPRCTANDRISRGASRPSGPAGPSSAMTWSTEFRPSKVAGRSMRKRAARPTRWHRPQGAEATRRIRGKAGGDSMARAVYFPRDGHAPGDGSRGKSCKRRFEVERAGRSITGTAILGPIARAGDHSGLDSLEKGPAGRPRRRNSTCPQNRRDSQDSQGRFKEAAQQSSRRETGKRNTKSWCMGRWRRRSASPTAIDSGSRHGGRGRPQARGRGPDDEEQRPDSSITKKGLRLRSRPPQHPGPTLHLQKSFMTKISEAASHSRAREETSSSRPNLRPGGVEFAPSLQPAGASRSST